MSERVSYGISTLLVSPWYFGEFEDYLGGLWYGRYYCPGDSPKFPWRSFTLRECERRRYLHLHAEHTSI